MESCFGDIDIDVTISEPTTSMLYLNYLIRIPSPSVPCH